MLRSKLSSNSVSLAYGFSIKSFFKKLLSRSSRVFQDTFEEQQQFSLRHVDPNKPPIPQTIKAAEKQIQKSEQEVNILEKQRLKNIDKVLGTNTYFYEPKSYQIKLDSEHVMMVKKLKAEAIVQRLKSPIKYDSKISTNFKIRNKNAFWKNLAKTRQYPQHKDVNFQQQSHPTLIELLAKEVLYTKMSFHRIEDLKNYFWKEDVELKTYLMYSPKYVYYNIPNTPLLGRTLKAKFPQDSDISKIPQEDIQVTMSLDEIYNHLLTHDNNPFVQQFLKDIENNTLKGTITEAIKWTENQNHLIILIDLTGDKKEYGILIKNLMSGQMVEFIPDTAQSLGILGNRVFFIRRDSLEMLTQLCYYDIQTKQTHLVYRETQQMNIKFTTDINGRYLYLYRQEVSNPWIQKVAVFGFENKQRIVQIPTEPGYQYEVAFIDKGFIYCKYEPNDKSEYCPLFQKVSKELHFIPINIKSQLTIAQSESMLRKIDQMKEIIQKYNEIAEKKIQIKHSVSRELVLSDKHEVIYKCEGDEAIQSVLNMKNEVILNIVKKWSTPDYKVTSKLHVIPRKQHTQQNSLIIPDQYISFGKVQDPYSQKVVFRLKNIVEPLFTFTTWNQQLQQDRPDTIHTQIFQYQCRQGQKQQLSLYCQQSYRGKCLDSIIIFTDEKESEIDFLTLRCLLKKGILVAVYKGKGSIYGSLQNYQQGAGENKMQCVNDLIDAVLSLHTEGRTTNIGIYSKGQYPANVVALLNVLQPYLFTASVVHNGNYGFEQYTKTLSNKRLKQSSSDNQQVQKQSLNISDIPFSNRIKSHDMIQIDDLSNILISSTSNYRTEARKLIHHLRKGKKRYDEVFYKQFQTPRDADMTNICYLYRILVDNNDQYSKIRDDFT